MLFNEDHGVCSMIDKEKLISRLVEGMREGVTLLPQDVTRKIEEAYENETSDVARLQLKAILENISLGRDHSLPLCQDTGIQIFFIKAGYDFPYLSEVCKSIPEAIERATGEVP